jgi:hypothetical protein
LISSTNPHSKGALLKLEFSSLKALNNSCPMTIRCSNLNQEKHLLMPTERSYLPPFPLIAAIKVLTAALQRAPPDPCN